MRLSSPFQCECVILPHTRTPPPATRSYLLSLAYTHVRSQCWSSHMELVVCPSLGQRAHMLCLTPRDCTAFCNPLSNAQGQDSEGGIWSVAGPHLERH